MILHRYIAWRYAIVLGSVTAALSAILVTIDLVEQIRVFGGQAPMSRLVTLSALNAPKAIYEILPLIVILASAALFISLARSSEMVVVRAAGRSAIRALIGPGAVILALGLATVVAGNPIIAATGNRADTLRAQLSGSKPQALATTGGGIWLREGDDDGQTVIRAAGSNLDGTVLRGVSLLRLSPDGTITERIEAQSATLIPGAWELQNLRIWPLTADLPAAEMQQLDGLRLPSTMTADQIRDGFGEPSSVPIWELPAYIKRLQLAGFTARRHQVWLQSELAGPVFLLAMLVLAAGLTMGHQRGGRTGVMVLTAVMIGFALYFLRNFAMVLGENGQIPVALSAWAPPVAALMIATGVLLAREDG